MADQASVPVRHGIIAVGQIQESRLDDSRPRGDRHCPQLNGLDTQLAG
jgi:hypothetical protein